MHAAKLAIQLPSYDSHSQIVKINMLVPGSSCTTASVIKKEKVSTKRGGREEILHLEEGRCVRVCVCVCVFVCSV